MGIGTHPECRQVSVMVGVAQQDLSKGTVLTVQGHHHSIAGLTEPSPYITTGVLSDDLTDMFVSMGRTAIKAQKVICFFIDEIQYMKANEMEALVNALHRVNQLRLPIILFGAGLPKVLRILGEVKSYSERLLQYLEVGELSPESAREAIEEPAKQLSVEYTEQAVNEIVRWTKVSLR